MDRYKCFLAGWNGKKYETAVIDELDTLLNQMNKCCVKLDLASSDALRKLSEFE
jgi:hypothetical protein